MTRKNDSLPSLDDLARRIESLKNATTEKPSDEPTRNNGMATAMRMGVEFVAGVAVGTLCGYFLDYWLGPLPWFSILCFFLGAAAGFKNMIRASQASENANEKKAEKSASNT